VTPTLATLATAVVLAPFAAAWLGILTGRRLPFGPGGVAVAGTGASLLMAIAVIAIVAGDVSRVRETSALLTPTGGIGITVGLRVDGLSASVAVMVAVVALAVQIYSIGYLQGDARYSSYAALVSLFTAAMLLVVLSGDLLVLYVGWEVMGLCSYFLIGHHWEDPGNTAAAVKAFLMTRIGDVGFLFGIFVLGVAADSFRITDVLAAAPRMSKAELLAGTLLLTLGVVAKSAQFPLHSWLPDAMAAPAPISALIHAATMVAAGVYVVARLHQVFLLAPFTLNLLAVLAGISTLGAALAAFAADDLKRVLAYSTISQLGLMFIGLAVGGRTVSVAHLFSHAAFKALLFLCAGAVIHTVGSNLMTNMGGLRRALPITFITMSIGFAALAGLPPTSGFFSKDAIVAAALHAATERSGSPIASGTAVVVLICALLTVAVTAAYATRAWLLTFFGPVRNDVAPHEAPPVMYLPLLALAVPALLLGLAAVNVRELRPEAASALASVALIVVGAGAAYLGWQVAPTRDPVAALGPARTALARAFYTDDLYERTIARMVRGLADGVARVDDQVIGRTVTRTGSGTRRLGGVLRLSENGNVQAYLTGVLAGVLVLAVGVAVLA
jgi:NADH-quinone oxidoreductase subunit L